MRSKSIWILLSILGLSAQLTGGTENTRTAQRKQDDGFMSFGLPSQSSQRQEAGSSRENYDYSNGFPQGFAQGLPTFDFSGPMASSDTNKEEVAAESEDNVGFVQGPPDGFPTLEQLGGKFPDFGESSEQPSSSQIRPFRPASPPERHSSYGPPDDQYDDYEPPHHHGHLRPETSEDSPVEDGPPGPYRRGPPPPPPPPPRRYPFASNSPIPAIPSQPPPTLFASAQASARQPYSKYPPGGSYSPHSGQPKKPIYIKTSTKNTKLPAGPPVFYAPSPDRQQSSQEQHDRPVGYEAASEIHQQQQPSFHPRYRRSTPEQVKEEVENMKPKDLKSAAAEPETFWELTSSPFIVFDTYKNEKESSTSDSNGNASFADHDGGEQRFFPSFPAPAPYLVGPFGGGPPSRPPLFPGPAANRAPSRYLPSFGPKFAPPPPPPNRGPSNVYTAESHDHYQDNNLLGSGNFEVVRGGTYYGDDDDGYHGGGGGGGPYHEHDDGDYFHHNGHSSPQEGYRLPAQDFFANFRDFADINPPSRAFSHRHEALAAEPRETITYANSHSSSSGGRQPKNILDKLENPTDSGASETSSAAAASSRDSDPMMATF